MDDDEELIELQCAAGDEVEDAILDEMMTEDVEEEGARGAEGNMEEKQMAVGVGRRKRTSPDDCFDIAVPEATAPSPSTELEKKRMRTESTIRSKGSGGTNSYAECLEDCLPRHIPIPPRRIAASILGEICSVTDQYGERVYCAMDDIGKSKTIEKDVTRALRLARGGLLSRPVEELMAELLEDKRRSVRDRLALEMKTVSPGEEEEMAFHEDNAALLVHKYSPKTFNELLSDERTNREVLLWLKQWDPCVFGIKAPKQPQRMGWQQGGGGGANNSGGNQGNKTYHYNKGYGKAPVEDVLERPQERILLISGAPGWGKTTLAQVVANHCGYKVVEVNASDDRTEGSLRRRILDAIQMKVGIGDIRPTCLILDEIDGALGGEGKGAIHALLSILKDDARADSALEDSERSNGGGAGPGGVESSDRINLQKGAKKKKGVGKLLRPIICICNDLYAQSLRPLRDVAKIFRFKAPSVTRMAKRLEFVCQQEGIESEPRALRSLVEISNCDIRSALNTMQLLSRQRKTLKVSDIVAVADSQKDVTQGAPDLWKKVFHTPRAQRKAFNQSEVDSFELYRSLNALGEHSLVLSGCFHNYANMNFHDPGLTAAVDCLDWMGDADLFMGHAYKQGGFELHGYLPAAVLKVKNHAAVPERPNIEWPFAESKANRERKSKLETLSTWRQSFDAEVATACSSSTMHREVRPYLMRIIAPQTLKAGAPQLMPQKQKRELEELVDTMLQYNLTYQAGFEFNAGLELEPRIDTLFGYPEAAYRPSGRPLSGQLRQIIVQQLQMERIHRAIKRTSLDDDDDDKAAVAKDTKKERPMPTALKEIQVKSLKAAKNPMALLFQRCNMKMPEKKKLKRRSDADLTPSKLAARSKVVYKYQEGFSNAVRRPLSIKDLL